jgi:hypothetical protein
MAGVILPTSRCTFFKALYLRLTYPSFQFVGNLWNEEAMNLRLNSVIKVTESRGITFRM